MELIMKVTMDNSAFADDPAWEITRIMRVATEFLATHSYPTAKVLLDINGNSVGFVEVKR